MKYVLAFIFSRDLQRVLLIKKARGPANLIGKWNGLGGKVKDGEGALEAVIREVREESKVEVDRKSLEYFCTLRERNGAYTVACYFGTGDIDKAVTAEEEEVRVWQVTALPYYRMDASAKWLVHMALDPFPDPVAVYGG